MHPLRPVWAVLLVFAGLLVCASAGRSYSGFDCSQGGKVC